MYRLITRATVPVFALLFLGSLGYSCVVGIARNTADHVGVPVAIMVFCLVIPFALCLFDRRFKTHVSCDTFGWHNGDAGDRTFDGCSRHAVCGKCGVGVMQDSQGNWY